ncbi:MAG TPA: hypothetical protein VGD58_11490 [Herpetosiphonaceae bacterium]
MQCPSCASEVSPGSSCSRCGAALTANSAAFSPGFSSNTAPVVDEGPARVPLTFTQLGSMQLVPGAHCQSTFGKRYRVCYSPASKIVRRLESLR